MRTSPPSPTKPRPIHNSGPRGRGAPQFGQNWRSAVVLLLHAPQVNSRCSLTRRVIAAALTAPAATPSPAATAEFRNGFGRTTSGAVLLWRGERTALPVFTSTSRGVAAENPFPLKLGPWPFLLTLEAFNCSMNWYFRPAAGSPALYLV